MYIFFYLSWENGENHILFNMIQNDKQEFSTANAIVASAHHQRLNYRTGFDFSIPFYSPNLYDYKHSKIRMEKHYLLVVSTSVLTNHYSNIFREQSKYDKKLLVIENCQNSLKSKNKFNSRVLCKYNDQEKQFTYPEVLEIGHFCLITLDGRFNHFTLLEAMAADCIPVIVNDIQITLPFHEVSANY